MGPGSPRGAQGRWQVSSYVTTHSRRGKAIRASLSHHGSYRWMLAALLNGNLVRPTWYRTRKDAEVVAHELKLQEYVYGRAYKR